MSSPFGNSVERISHYLEQPFTVTDVSKAIRNVTGEEDTVTLDIKIRYHLSRINVPVVCRNGGCNGQTVSYEHPEIKRRK